MTPGSSLSQHVQDGVAVEAAASATSVVSVPPGPSMKPAIKPGFSVENDLLLETVLGTISEGFAVIDRDWRLTYVNDNIARMAGMERARLLGKKAWDLFPDLVGTRLYSELQQALLLQKPAHFEFHYPPANRWSEHRVCPIKGGLAIFSSDITERKLREEALRKQEEWMRFNLEAVEVGTWEWNILSRTVQWSENMEKLHGLDPGSFGGTLESFLVCVHPDDRDRLLKSIETAIEGDGRFEVEYRRLTPDESVKWMEGKGRVTYDDAHRPVRMMGISMDVTPRKLRLDLLRFQANALSQVNDVVFALDREQRVTYWNKAAELLYGHTSEEMIGRKLLDVIQFRWIRPEDEEACRKSLADTGAWRGESIRVKKNGEEIYVESSVSTLGGGETGIDGYLVVTRDITARKLAEIELRRLHQEQEARAEAALQDATETLRKQAQLLDLAHDAIIVRNADSSITYWNQGAEKTYGWTQAEARGKSTHDLLQTKFPQPLAEVHYQLFQEGWWEGELVHTRRDGVQITVESRQVVQRDEAGETIGILEINRDVTNRKRSEERARESDERFRLLVEGVNDYAILMLDPAGHVLSWNLGAHRITGYERAEILGKHFSIFYPDQEVSAGKPERALALAARDGRWEEEGRRVRKDGSQFWASVLMTALHDSEGNLRGFSKVTRDVTERKRAEESLRDLSSRLLNAQDEERRRLARELHDSTAQVLSALSLNLALLEHTADPELSGQAAKALAESQKLADQASREIRTFSYLLHPPLLDQAGLDQALRWYIDGFAQRTKIEVALEILPPEFDRLPAEVETALFRIVQECLTNIYRHSGSSIAEVRLVRDSSEVRLGVRDRGKGLLGGSSKWDDESPVGTGVGIRGMRERVRQLGGSITFATAQPGTVTEVVLPLPQRGSGG